MGEFGVGCQLRRTAVERLSSWFEQQTPMIRWKLGGLKRIGNGMIGEYLGRAFFEAKQRPANLIWKVIRCQFI